MSTSPSQSAPLSTPRPSVIQLAIKEKAALFAAYIPMFAEGGLFIPSPRDHKLGDDMYVPPSEITESGPRMGWP